jgi:hypothetical protein
MYLLLEVSSGGEVDTDCLTLKPELQVEGNKTLGNLLRFKERVRKREPLVQHEPWGMVHPPPPQTSHEGTHHSRNPGENRSLPRSREPVTIGIAPRRIQPIAVLATQEGKTISLSQLSLLSIERQGPSCSQGASVT